MKNSHGSAPDLNALHGVVSDQVLDAMKVASAQLSKLGVRHALVGGLAVGAYGFPRATKDVDFLVGGEAFLHHEEGLVSVIPGAPVMVGRVMVDLLYPMPGDDYLFEGIGTTDGKSVPVAPVHILVCMKLKSPRHKDFADLVELLKAGIDASSIESYVASHAPELLLKFHDAVAAARREES